MKVGNWRFLLWFALFVVVIPLPVKADSIQLETGPYLKGFYKIPIEFSKEVFTLDKQKLKRNSLIAGAVLLTYTQDENIRDFWHENITGAASKSTYQAAYDLGTPGGMLALHGVIGLAGLGFQNEYLSQTTALSFQAGIVSQIITEPVKLVAGRERPNDSNGQKDKWREGGKSFFSGHASGSFAVATIFAERYKDNNWVYYGSYLIAAGVSASRISADGHFASDVLLGGIVGHVVAKKTLQYSTKKHNDRLALYPYPVREGMGIQASYRF